MTNIADPFKNIWESRNLANLNSNPLELDNKRSQFRRGLGAFADEMQATGYGLAALGAQGIENAVGQNDVTSGIRDWGIEGYKKNIEESHSGVNAPSVARLEDIKTATDAADWASYQLGKGLPMLGSLALTGGIGGAVGRLTAKEGIGAVVKSATGDVVKKTVESGALKAVEGQVITDGMKAAASKALRDRIETGAIAGGFTGSFGLEGGQSFGETVSSGVNPADAVKSAVAVGGINGALEFLPFYKVAKDIGLGSYAKKKIGDIISETPELAIRAVKLAKELGGRAIGAGAEGAAVEGITESLQELVSIAGERWAKNDPLFSELTSDDWSRIANAGVAGALVGSVAAGAGGTVVGPHGQTTDTTPEPAPVNEEKGAPRIENPRASAAQITRDKINEELALARQSGDEAKVGELQSLRDSFDAALQQNELSTEAQSENQAQEEDVSSTLAKLEEQLKQQAEQPERADKSQLINELKFDLSVINPDNTDFADKWGQDVYDEVAKSATRPQDAPQEWWDKLAVKAVRQPKKELATLIESNTEIPESLGGDIAKSLVEDKGFSPNTVEGLIKLAPEGFKLTDILDGTTPVPVYEKGNEEITIHNGEFIHEKADGLVDVYPSHASLLEGLGITKESTNVKNESNISAAVADGKPTDVMSELTDSFKLTDNDTKWNIDYSPYKSLEVTSKTDNLEKYKGPIKTKPQWQFTSDGDNNLVTLYHGNINGKSIINTFDMATSKYLNDLIGYSEKTNPWKVGELQADIELFGINNTQLTDKWGEGVTGVILNTPLNSTLFDYIEAAAKEKQSNESPPVNSLQHYIQNGLDVPKSLGGVEAEKLVFKDGLSPNTAESLMKMIPKGWKFIAFASDDKGMAASYAETNGDGIFLLTEGSFQYKANPNSPTETVYDYPSLLKLIENNSKTSSIKDTVTNEPADKQISWSSKDAPNGYDISGPTTILSLDGAKIEVSNSLSAEDKAAVAHIHEYIKHAPISIADKIDMFKKLPTTKEALTLFQDQHPYLIRKVSIDEATTPEHGRKLLNDILVRRDKYTFEEILQESIKFNDKFGNEEFISALTAAPKDIIEAPHLDGWLSNPRSEKDLLTENPFEGIWADYPVNGTVDIFGNTGPAPRYGVIIINPKTGKVLLRKVANQFEGITWDFARGGADRFGFPNAKPNLIDTNHSNPSKRYMEHPLLAAKREAREEFGYDVNIVGQLAKGFFSGDNSMASLYYVGVPVGEQTDEHLNPTHGVKETDETRWVSLAEARQLVTTMPTAAPSVSMKIDGKHKPRIARISRILEAVYNPAMQKSDLDYRSSPAAMEMYFNNKLKVDFPQLGNQLSNKSFDTLTEIQKIKLAAALYVSQRYPNAMPEQKQSLMEQRSKQQVAALRAWSQDKIGSNKISSFVNGSESIKTIDKVLEQNGGKIVLSLWHGSKTTHEALMDDIINPAYFGTGWGGHDTKEGMYLADSKESASKWGNKTQVNVLVAFNNLKTVEGEINYGSMHFNDIIAQAKADGRDGVFFNKVSDTHVGRQIIIWNPENVVSGSGLPTQYSGKTIYQTQGELGESISASTAKIILNDTFGPEFQNLIDSGFIDLVEAGGPDGIAGEYLGSEKKIKVYLDYISSPRELIGAVLHEGSHAGMQAILGNSAKEYHSELLASNSQAMKVAMYKTAWEGARRYGIENSLTPENTNEIERVRDKLNLFDPQILLEEDLANFTQQGDVNSSLWQKIVNAIKTWWAKSSIGKALKSRGFGFELTPDMAVGLVTEALRTQSIRRGDDYSTYVAHVSGANWKSEAKFPFGRPLLKYVLGSAGEGYISYGWGFYALESQATLSHYKGNIGPNTYGLHLPDDIPLRMIEWDRPLAQQSSIVKDAITSNRDNYLLLRMAVDSKDRKSSYSDSIALDITGTGSAFYNQLRDHYAETQFGGDLNNYIFDPETQKTQKVKNLARRAASRKLAEYGISGIRLLDAGSRRVTITKQPNQTYKLTRGAHDTLTTKILDDKELLASVGPELANTAKQQQIGETKTHPGFGFYNWVFWRQSDLDRFQVVYKNGNQVTDKPTNNVAYDPNGVGVPYAENPGFSDYVINPKTGEQLSYSQADKTIGVDIEDIRNSIDSVMGPGWLAAAEKAGLVEVVDDVGPSGESGSWDGDKIKLYAGSMPAGGSPIGVLLHEGKHSTFSEVLGDSLSSYVNDLRTMADSGNQTARDAILQATVAAADLLGIKHGLREGGTLADLDNVRAAIEEKRPGLLAEEELAYFTQYGAEVHKGIGFFNRLFNQIKAWFAQTALGKRLKEMNVGFEMTPLIAAEWAKMGLHKILSAARNNEKTNNSVMHQAAYKQPSALLGDVAEAVSVADPFYSMGFEEFKNKFWTDPTSNRADLVNKPGLFQRFRANFIDFFAEIEKKSSAVYDTYTLLRNKKAALVEQFKQEYAFPLRKLVVNSPWTAEEVSDMLAARHIKLDNVNTDLAERASDNYVKELMKHLSDSKKASLKKARANIKAGLMTDGSDYLDANGNVTKTDEKTKRRLMYELMNLYAPYELHPAGGVQKVRDEWERFKDAAGGFSNGGVGKDKVRTVDDILKLADKDPAKFAEISDLFDAMNRRTLDILEKGGLITDTEHSRLLADKSAYAPLHRKAYQVDQRIEQLLMQAGTGGSKKLGTRTGTADLSEPVLVIQNALAGLESAAAAAEKNRANEVLYDTIIKDKAGWKPWFTIVDKDKYTTHDSNGFLQEKNSTALNRTDIVLIRKGKKLIIRPNQHNERAVGFVRAVNNLDAQVLTGPMQVLNWVNGIVRWVNVTASPIFLMMNAIKDPFTAAYNLQASEAANYTKDIMHPAQYKKVFSALKKVFVDGVRDQNDTDVQLVERYEAAGGRTSFTDVMRAMDDTWRNFDGQVARRKGDMKYLMSIKDKWIDGIENYNILFENVMRLSTFDVLTNKGVVSDTRAARIAQDLTTNFSRHGYYSQALGNWWLFFNATVQGNYQVLRNIIGSKKVQAAAVGTIVTAALLDAFGRSVDDDWDKIPEWDKDRFIILPIKVGGDFVKIPAPWTYNVVWRMGSMLSEALAGKRTAQDTAIDMASILLTTFNPIASGSIAQAIAPTAADPIVQILENKDFAGNPLGPEGYPGASKKANSELIWSNTPKGYQDVARWVNEFTGGSAVESGLVDLRPVDYQVLAKFMTGSLGRFLTNSTFGLKEAVTEGIEGPKDIPVFQEFVSDPYNPMRAETYHNNISKVYGAHKLEMMYSQGPDRNLTKLQEVRQERGDELRMYAQAKDVEKQLKSLRTQIRIAENRKDSARVKELRRKIEAVQDRFNESYRSKVG